MVIAVFDELKTLLRQSGLPLRYVAYRSGVERYTLTMWLNGKTHCPRIDTMTKVAMVLGKHIALTPTVAKMVNYYPAQAIKPPPPLPFPGMTRHQYRMAMMRVQ